ncbi:uncharacterized protein [Watersipora subatra]|uniref:uncharacterized protein n=1 Tax=Watersipora subatra TaxID=2589382 RepID=UPI00355B0829
MDKEVRRAEAELNKALAEVEQHLNSLKAQSSKIYHKLNQVTQSFEASETMERVLLKSDDLLSNEEKRMLTSSKQKEKDIASLQDELRSHFDREKSEHKVIYEDISKSMRELFNLKKDYDAVKLGHMLDSVTVKSFSNE